MRRADPFNPALSARQTPWLVLCAAVVLAPLIPHLPLWLSLGAGAALAWRGWLWTRHASLPSRWWVTLLVLAGTVAVFLNYKTVFGRDPGAALLALFLALKLMELRTLRDAMTVVFLCYFLQIAVFFHSQDPHRAALTVATSLFITATLIKLNDDTQPFAFSLRKAALMLAQAAPFMLALFLLFPRVQGPLWGMPQDAYSGLSGLSDTMEPGSISDLTLSGAIAFRVNFAAAPPPQHQLYWRGPVLTSFDGRAWRQNRPSLSPSMPYTSSGTGLDYTVTLEAHDKTWLFALELPAAPPSGAFATTDFQLVAGTPVRTRQRYELRSYPGFSAGADEAESAQRTALQLPAESNPRARALAVQWRAETADDAELMRRALRYFREQGFVYTLSPPLLGVDAVDEFLLDTRRGFCEHYASSFVFLMRAAGVPARVVTGYQGGEMNPIDGYLIVRQSDAHAWAEVWMRDRGWLRVDPTAMIAPSRVDRGLAAAVPLGDPLPFVIRADYGWLRALRFRWEAASNTWNQWVLGYNALRQRDVLERLGMSTPDWREMTAALALLCGMILLGLTGWALRQRSQSDPAQQAWERMSRKLAQQGLARHAWEGPLDYAERIAQARPQVAGEVRALAQLYIAARYAPHPRPEALRQLQQRVRALHP